MGEQTERWAEVCKHLDLTRTSVREVLAKTGLKVNDDLDEIRTAYIKRLRTAASGHGGDEKKELDIARKNDLEVSTEIKRLEYLQKSGVLVDIDETQSKFEAWGTYVIREFESTIDQMFFKLKSDLGVDVERDNVGELIDAYRKRVIDYAGQLSENDGEGKGQS